MENLTRKSLLSDLQPNIKHLFVKSTLCFKRDFNRFGFDEPMALAIEQHLLDMSSLRFHDLLYGLCLLWWHYLVLCSLQELYPCQQAYKRRARCRCLRRSKLTKSGL